jgi:hypothetical protein
METHLKTNNMTAVEWLIEQLSNYDLKMIELFKEEINQAKEMEKQQMKDAVLSQCTTHEGLRKIFEKQFEKYYKKTYK